MFGTNIKAKELQLITQIILLLKTFFSAKECTRLPQGQKIHIIIDNGWYKKSNLKNDLLLFIKNIYIATKFEQQKITGQNRFLTVDINFDDSFM